MLVLARRVGEEILIGDDIRIKVVSLRRGCVRIGIEAPAHVRIMRMEKKVTVENPSNTGAAQ